MANIEEAIRRLKYLYEVHGAEQVAAAQRAITATTTETERAALSLEKRFNNLERTYVDTVRHQQAYAKVQRDVNAAVAQNPALQERANVILQNAQQRYTAASQGAQAFGKALNQGTGEVRLARHELINLSRQIQDVGVGIVSGQSPFTILVQQGTQIADVFATSSGTIRGFFGQAASGAARFLGSATGIAGSAAAIGVALVAAGSSAASAQRDIEKALTGIGRASGVTRDQINQIATASSSAFGLSVSEARTAASAFAATGKIHAANVEQATKLVNDFARSGGDAAEMTKKLAEALQDPAKGAMELNKQYGFLNAATLENIRNLQAQGQEQQAQKALMDALNPTMQKQAELIGTWGKAWNIATNFMSNYFSQLGKDVLTVGEKMTGASLGGFTTEEQLGRARETLAERQKYLEPYKGPLARKAIQSAHLEVARLEAKKLAEELDRAATAFNKLSTEALSAADGFLPLQAKIRETEQALAKLREFQAAGGFVDPAAITAGEILLQQSREQEASLIRKNQYTQELAASYPGMSMETAKQLALLEQQLPVINARTDRERAVAQEIATQNKLKMEGVSLEDRLAIAAAQRRNTEAQIAASAAKANEAKSNAMYEQMLSLQDQVRLAEGMSKATIEYGKAIRQGFSKEAAQWISNQHQRLEDIQDEKRERQQAAQQQQQQQQQNAQANQAYIQQYNANLAQALETVAEIEHHWANIPGIMTYLIQQGNQFEIVTKGLPQFKTWTNAAGQAVQFNPEGYQSSTTFGAQMDADTAAAMKLYGPGGYTEKQEVIDNMLVTRIIPKVETLEEAMARLGAGTKDLTKSTDALNATMQNALSPFYSQDPRTTKLGFRAGVVGNPDWLAPGASNATPLAAILGPGATAPGMADGGSFVVGGGYSANDNRIAAFPVASGEEIVVNRNRRQGSGPTVINIDNRTVITGSLDGDAMAKLKVTKYQQSQRMRGALARA